MGERRRTFGPVVLAGLASAGLAAVAGNQPWAVPDSGPALVSSADAGKVPLAGALALVVLASWGVLLVTRGVVRRGVAVIALLAALGLVAVTVSGIGSAPDAVRAALAQLASSEGVGVHRTAWPWVALACALVAVVACGAAGLLAGSWPEMGARYDAPGPAPQRLDTADASGIDLWRALDEGRDPTLPDGGRDAP